MTIYIPTEIMLGVPILLLGVILISFPADDDIHFLIRFFMVISFFWLTACTSAPKAPQSFSDCTKAKVGNYNATLNGVGPEFLEKLNRAIEECEATHDTK